MNYHLAALGGTFDRLHQGHQQLIQTALNQAEKIIVGITTPLLVTDKPFSHLIESFEKRQQNVIQFLESIHALDRTSLVELIDPYGPTLTNPQIDALVVSTQTKPGGEEINRLRQQRNLTPLAIVEATMVSDETGDHLSSTHIREGLAARSGRSFVRLFDTTIRFNSETLVLLKEPQGQLFDLSLDPIILPNHVTKIALVGDSVTHYFLDRKLPFNVAIIDGKTQRHDMAPKFNGVTRLTGSNPPGTINAEIAQQIMSNSTSGSLLEVNGEEDLLAFVPCLTFPLNSVVFYGQPQQGIVMITLTEAVKLRLARFIDPTFE